MMKFSWILLLAGIALSGCLKSKKECPPEPSITAPEAEQQQIEAYLASSNMTAIKHPSGFYYQILNPGSGARPEGCAVVTVSYVGRLSNGNIFDQRNPVSFDIGQVIVGWRKGIKLIQKGGSIKLFIPPSLGYGDVDIKDGNTVVIPAKSMLIFDVELFEVN